MFPSIIRSIKFLQDQKHEQWHKYMTASCQPEERVRHGRNYVKTADEFDSLCNSYRYFKRLGYIPCELCGGRTSDGFCEARCF
jgi:hypothetical protein